MRLRLRPAAVDVGVRLAVDRAARRGEGDALEARLATGLHEVQQAEDVDRRVELRVCDRAAHVHLRREVAERGRTELPDEGRRLGAADVQHVEGRALRDVLADAAREVVHHVDLAALGDERLGDVGADKPGAAGDEDRPAGVVKGIENAGYLEMETWKTGRHTGRRPGRATRRPPRLRAGS